MRDLWISCQHVLRELLGTLNAQGVAAAFGNPKSASVPLHQLGDKFWGMSLTILSAAHKVDLKTARGNILERWR
jgi:hypothetical protein